jgi:hypothetical protein
MQGLELLVRLIRYHPKTINSQLQHIVLALRELVCNNHSQVAQAACQAAGELFVSQKGAFKAVSLS